MRAFLFLLLLIPFFVKSQMPVAVSEIVNFDKHSYSAGSQNWAVIQDQQGFIYAGNNEGLLCYDGTFWKKYSLPNNTIVRSLAMHKNRLFVGGQDEIGYYTTHENGRLTYHSLKNLIKEESRSFSDIWKIVVFGEEVFFMSTHHIFRYDGEKIEEFFRNDKVWTFLGQYNGRLIAQTALPELLEFKNNRWENIKGLTELPQGFLITGLTEFGKGTGLVTTEKHGAFLWVNETLQPFNIQHGLNHEPAYSGVLRIDADRFALSSFSDGCLIINKEGVLLEHYYNKTGIQNNNIRSIIIDKNKNLWLALDTGIDFIAFDNAIKHIMPEEFFGSAGYSSLLDEEYLYLGLSNGVYVAKLQSGIADIGEQKVKFTVVPESEGQVWSLSKLNDKILLGKHDGLFEIKNGKAFAIDKSLGYWIFKEYINEKDSSKLILTGSYNGIKIVKNGTEPQSFNNEFNETARFLVIDKEAVWASHPYRGVFKISKPFHENAEVRLYTEKNGLPSTMNNFVFYIKGKLAVATEKGVYEYNPITDLFEPSAFFKNIFGNMSLFYLKEDAQGNIWFIHKKSLGVVDFTEGKNETIYFSELNEKTVTGFEYVNPINPQNILVGSEKGFYLINYNKYKRNNKELRVFIRSAVSYGQQDSVLTGNEILNQESNSVHFEFSSPLFEQQSNIEYSFMLDGFENNWSEWSGKTERDYSNLKHGRYIFKVKARNNLGNESPIVSFNFSVRPPWYLSPWAYPGYLLLALLLLYLVKVKTDKRLEKQHLRHIEEQERLRNLHQLELDKSEKEIVKLKNEKLESEIEFKNSELASSAMHLVQKGELLKKIKTELQKLAKGNLKNGEADEMKKLIKLLTEEERMNEDWEQFAVHFNNVHSNFLVSMKERYPNLSAHELKLCAYLRMNLASKEIAQLMNISVRGVEISRYRLRKKLNIPTEVNLFQFMLEVQSEENIDKK